MNALVPFGPAMNDSAQASLYFINTRLVFASAILMAKGRFSAVHSLGKNSLSDIIRTMSDKEFAMSDIVRIMSDKVALLINEREKAASTHVGRPKESAR